MIEIGWIISLILGKVLIFVLATFCWTKSLSCTVTDFTGMPYQFRVIKYSDFISLIWKGPHYDKISVTSIKKEFSNSKETLQSLQLSKSRIPSLSSEWSCETPGHSSDNNINNDAFKSGVQSIFRSLLQRYVSRRFCTDSKSKKSDPLHPSGRRGIPSGHSSVKQHPFERCDILSRLSTVQTSSVRTTRTFRPDLPLC
jgi:hypothetical protein